MRVPRTRLAVLAALAIGSRAHADPAHDFGRRGTIVVSAERLVPLLAHTEATQTRGADGSTTSVTSLGLFSYGVPEDSLFTIPRLAFDYAVVPNLTVGGTVTAYRELSSYSVNPGLPPPEMTSEHFKLSGWAVAPRVGYTVPLARNIVLWPRAGISYYSGTIKTPSFDHMPNLVTGFDQLTLSLEANFLILVGPGTFLSVSPVLDLPITGPTTANDYTQLHYGLTMGVGGYLGATASSSSGARPDPAADLGRRGTLLVGAERVVPLFAYTVEHGTYVSSEATSYVTSVALLTYGMPHDIAFTVPRLSVDYEVEPHVTIGGSVMALFQLSYRASFRENGMTGSTTYPKTSAAAVAPRLGLVLPLGHRFAVWPRAGVSYFTESAKASYARGYSYEQSNRELAVDLEANGMFVLAPGFFVTLAPVLDIPVYGSTTGPGLRGPVSIDHSQLYFGVTMGLGGYL